MNIALKNKISKRILSQLNVSSSEELSKWSSRDYQADGKLVTKFWDAIEKAPAVKIIGDYDVDGICASYIMATSIQNTLKKKVSVRIPHRFSEGYGFNEKIADEIREKNEPGTLIITVDNGITAADVLESLEQDGYPVIVTDHHELKTGRMPEVSMVIDPKTGSADQLAGDYWCGAGVALKLVEQYVTAEQKTDAEAFAAIATAADCVTLKEGNWALVRKTIQSFRNDIVPPQIKLLSEMLGQPTKFCTEDTFYYYIGPALNANGRLFDNGGAKALSYLIAPTLEKAQEIVNTNNDRKELRDKQYQTILDTIYADNLQNNCPIWVKASDLHQGIIGILAGHITEDFGVPAIVLTETPDGTLKGSARSVPGVNILDYLCNCGAQFIALGGHEGAAGMTMTKGEFEKARMSTIPGFKPGKKTAHPIAIDSNDIPDIFIEVNKYYPYGEGNPPVPFAVEVDTNSKTARFAGKDKNHLIFTDPDNKWKITKFNFVPNDLEDHEHFCISGNIVPSAFNGKETPTLNGEDVSDILSQSEKGKAKGSDKIHIKGPNEVKDILSEGLER